MIIFEFLYHSIFLGMHWICRRSSEKLLGETHWQKRTGKSRPVRRVDDCHAQDFRACQCISDFPIQKIQSVLNTTNAQGYVEPHCDFMPGSWNATTSTASRHWTDARGIHWSGEADVTDAMLRIHRWNNLKSTNTRSQTGTVLDLLKSPSIHHQSGHIRTVDGLGYIEPDAIAWSHTSQGKPQHMLKHDKALRNPGGMLQSIRSNWDIYIWFLYAYTVVGTSIGMMIPLDQLHDPVTVPEPLQQQIIGKSLATPKSPFMSSSAIPFGERQASTQIGHSNSELDRGFERSETNAEDTKLSKNVEDTIASIYHSEKKPLSFPRPIDRIDKKKVARQERSLVYVIIFNCHVASSWL
jgi:hypothetical protein